MDRNKNELKTTTTLYTNASEQIPVPYGSKPHIQPTNHHFLAAQQEPYTKKPISQQQQQIKIFTGEIQENRQ